MYINDEYWEILLVSPNHPLLHGSLGSCDDVLKTIFLREDLPDSKLKKVLCHEIAHAAMFSYNVALSDVMEEIFADLIATYGEEIIFNTNRIFDQLYK